MRRFLTYHLDPKQLMLDDCKHGAVDVQERDLSDTGVGIAPEDQEAIEEFQQVGTAAERVEGRVSASPYRGNS